MSEEIVININSNVLSEDLKTLSEYEKGFLTGFIEADGSLYISRYRKNGYWHYSAFCAFYNTNYKILEKVASMIINDKQPRMHGKTKAGNKYYSIEYSNTTLRWLLPQLTLISKEKKRIKMLELLKLQENGCFLDRDKISHTKYRNVIKNKVDEFNNIGSPVGEFNPIINDKEINLSEWERGFLEAFIDCDGCIYMINTPSLGYRISLIFYNNNLSVLTKIKEIVKSGTVAKDKRREKINYRLVTQHNVIKKLFPQISLVIKDNKRKLALELVSVISNRRKFKSKEEYSKLKDEIYSKFKGVGA